MIATALQNIILDTIRVPETHQRYDEITEAHVRTFGWLLRDEALDGRGNLSVSDFDSQFSGQSDPSFSSRVREEDDTKRVEARDLLIKWLRDESGIFHICGKPGSGKSVLMKYISSHPQLLCLLKAWAGSSALSVGTFFLWRPGTSSQKKLPGLIRGLLHSLLSNSQDLVPIAFPELSKSPAAFIRTQSPMDDRGVRKAFNNILDWLAAGSAHRTALLIDGLDELDGDFPDLVRTLFHWVDHCRGSLKILVSSREWNIFEKSFSNCPRIRLHEVTMRDMEIFISERLDSNDEFLEFDSGVRLDIKYTIATKAEGVFLWVALVLRITEEALLAGDSPSELLVKLAECPPELEELLSRILESIRITDRRWAFRAIELVRIEPPRMTFTPFSLPPMSLLMWTFLGDYNSDTSFALKLSPRECSSEDIRNRINLARRMIYGRCKGLLEVVSSPRLVHSIRFIHRQYQVKVIHSSIWEFLQQHKVQAVMQPHVVGFDVSDCVFQSFLAMLTISCPYDYYELHSDNKIPINWTYGFRLFRKWKFAIPNTVVQYVEDLLWLQLSSSGFDRSSRTWQALDAVGPVMGQMKYAGHPRNTHRVIDNSQWEWNELGLSLSFATGCYEYLDWKLAKPQETPSPLPHRFYGLVAYAYANLLRLGPTHDIENRIIKMTSRLSRLEYDWNWPIHQVGDPPNPVPHIVVSSSPGDIKRQDGLAPLLYQLGGGNDYHIDLKERALSTWESILAEMIQADYVSLGLLDSLIRQGVNTECIVLQCISEEVPVVGEVPGEGEVPGGGTQIFALYHNGASKDALTGIVTHIVRIPVSSPLCYLAWKCNFVIRFWDLVRFQVPELFEYYVQLAASPLIPPPEILTTAKPMSCIGFERYYVRYQDDAVTPGVIMTDGEVVEVGRDRDNKNYKPYN